MRLIRRTTQFRKDVKRVKKRGKKPAELKKVIADLAAERSGHRVHEPVGADSGVGTLGE